MKAARSAARFGVWVSTCGDTLPVARSRRTCRGGGVAQSVSAGAGEEPHVVAPEETMPPAGADRQAGRVLDAPRLVSPASLGRVLADHCCERIFLCLAGPDTAVLDAVASHGVPVDQIRIETGSRDETADDERCSTTRRLSETRARIALGGTYEEFLLLDDVRALRLSRDDHDRLVVGFLEPDAATDRYRLARDLLWAAAAGSA
ncbi:hypothetical protein ACQP04_23100 [Pseudonocardia halophobica]|uniref:hypothetical protein n=1 Tax=Pseudonocardia halophobica TaxID=29401 RepID=UPI003D8EE095